MAVAQLTHITISQYTEQKAHRVSSLKTNNCAYLMPPLSIPVVTLCVGLWEGETLLTILLMPTSHRSPIPCKPSTSPCVAASGCVSVTPVLVCTVCLVEGKVLAKERPWECTCCRVGLSVFVLVVDGCLRYGRLSVELSVEISWLLPSQILPREARLSELLLRLEIFVSDRFFDDDEGGGTSKRGEEGRGDACVCDWETLVRQELSIFWGIARRSVDAEVGRETSDGFSSHVASSMMLWQTSNVREVILKIS